MVEHRWTLEPRERTKRTPLGNVDHVHQWRWVCACGYMTRWHRDQQRARRERARHALDGQLAHDA